MGKGDSMNKTERDLLQFLKSLPEDIFDNWLEKASDEQLALADRLFDEERYSKLDVVEDLDVAKSVLQKFTLKG